MYRLTCVFMAWKKVPEVVIPIIMTDIFRSRMVARSQSLETAFVYHKFGKTVQSTPFLSYEAEHAEQHEAPGKGREAQGTIIS